VFGSGTAAQTSAVTDPGAFAQSGHWIPIAVGVVTALVVSLTKSTVRPAANVATAGMAAPVLSTVEDIASIGLVFLAVPVPVPVLVLVAVLALVWAVMRIVRRRRRKAAAKAAPTAQLGPTP
jgi:ribose/xylose/arabinose/galactoside ABC-type transport system permease subunit